MNNWKETIKRDWLVLLVFVMAIVLCFYVYNETDRMLQECNEFWLNECGYNNSIGGIYGYDSNGSKVIKYEWKDQGHSDTTGAGLNIPMQGKV